VAQFFDVPQESMVLAKYRPLTNTYQLFSDALSYYLATSSSSSAGGRNGGHTVQDDAWATDTEVDIDSGFIATSEEVAQRSRSNNICTAQFVTDGGTNVTPCCCCW
jgi:hypothetical protein